MMGTQKNTYRGKYKSLTAGTNRYNLTKSSSFVKLVAPQPKPLSSRDLHRQEVALKRKKI